MPIGYYPYGVTEPVEPEVWPIWRGLEGYVPVIARAAIPGGGGVIIVNYLGRGILMSTSYAAAASPVSVRIDVDGVTLVNAVIPESQFHMIGFATSLWVQMVSGGAGGPGQVTYLHE